MNKTRLLIGFIYLILIINPSFANRRYTDTLDFVAGILPNLEVEIHSSDLELDFDSEIPLTRLRIKTDELIKNQNRFDTAKIVAYEYINGKREEISSSIVSLKQKSPTRFDVVLNKFSNSSRLIYFDLFAADGSFINTYSKTINAKNLDLQSEANELLISDSDCSNLNFGSCELKYFFENVNFEAVPERQFSTKIIKDENGKYRVRMPVLGGAKVKIFNNVTRNTVSNDFDLGSYSIDFDEKDSNLKFSFLGNEIITINQRGSLGIGTNTPRASLEIAAQSDFAPILLNPSSLVNSPLDGALEFDGIRLFFTSNGVRKGVAFSGENTVINTGGFKAGDSIETPIIQNPKLDGISGEGIGKYLKLSSVDGSLVWDSPAGAGDMISATYDAANVSEQVVGLSATQTLTNKTISSGIHTGTMTHSGGHVVFNDNAGNFNFTVKSSNNDDLFSIDGASDALTINGDLAVFNIADNPVNGRYLKLIDVAAGTLAWDTPAGGVGGDMAAATYDAANVSEQLVGLTATQTLTNKTLTTPLLNNPKIDGLSNEQVGRILQLTNLDGSVTWADSVLGGISDVISDTSPQLGGQLDLNSFGITDAVAILMNGTLLQTDGDITLNRDKGDYALSLHGENIDNLLVIKDEKIGILAGTTPTKELEINGEVLFNSKGRAYDFQVQGDTDSDLFFIDGSADRVGISTNSPAQTLDVQGTFNVSGLATLGSGLDVTGATTLDALTLGGDLELGGFEISDTPGDVTVNDDLSVTGLATVSTFKLTTGAGAGRLLASDADGDASWVTTIAANVIAADGINFTELSDSLALDASTDIAADGTEVLSITNIGTGNSFQVNDSAGDASPFVIDNSGNVGILKATPAEALDVSGNIQASGNIKGTAFISTSDKRFKTDLEKSKGIELIKKLKGYSYSWKKDGVKDYGVIAQELQEVIPELVVENPETGYLAVKYNGLIAPLIEAVKELEERLEAEKVRNDKLEEKLNKIIMLLEE